MKAQTRGANPPAASHEVDPFADLAEMFESEIGRAALAAHPGSSAPFETEFAEALAADMVRPVGGRSPAPGNPYQNWIAPRPVRLADPMDDGAAYAPGQRSPLALQSDLEEALRGLSAPANPRHSIVVETQSFAPDRVVDEPIEDTTILELDDFDELIQSELAVMHRHEESRSTRHGARLGHAAAKPLPAGVDYAVAIEDGDPSGAYAFDQDPDEGRPRRRFLSRGVVMLGGGVAALALVGFVGVSLLGKNGGASLIASSGEPLLIKADATPFKMVPKDPGGRSIPNQNKAVYERVASPAVQAAPTTQQALLRESEEPIELPDDAASADESYDNNLPGVELVDNEGLGLKDESRVEASAADVPDNAPVPVLQPRKVRTTVVRADGKIVPVEEPAAAPPAAAPTLVAAAAAAPTVADQPALIEVSSNTPRRTAETAPRRAAEIAGATALVEEAAPAVMPEPAVAEASPVAPSGVDPRSMLPVQVADPMEVAAIAPVPTAEMAASRPPTSLPMGGYFVQISSQPSEALAQKSLQNLGGKFARVIEGRSVGIQPADIPGKGTFYRVRIAADSKSEASSLCNRLKAAGGNCFVAR